MRQSLLFLGSKIDQRFIYQCLDINQVVELSVQIVGQVLDILPGRLFVVRLLEHSAEFEYVSDVVAFVFVLELINPFMNLSIRFAGSLYTNFDMFFYAQLCYSLLFSNGFFSGKGMA